MLAITVDTENGQRHARITAERLAELTEGLGARGNRFLVVERISGDEDVYIQVWHELGGGYRLEHRDGSPERHFGAGVAGAGQVADVMARWARQQDGWDAGLAWESVNLEAEPDAGAGQAVGAGLSAVSEVSTVPEDVREEFEEYVRLLIVAGYEAREDVIEAAEEWLDDEVEGSIPADCAEQLVDRLWMERLAEQAQWTGTTDPERITQAFAVLASRGITAREHFACCSTCGNAEIGEEAAADARGFVYFHTQCTDSAAAGHGLMLLYGGFDGFDGAQETTAAVGREVVAALAEAGLRTEWDGSPSQAISVTPLDWRKRLPR